MILMFSGCTYNFEFVSNYALKNPCKFILVLYSYNPYGHATMEIKRALYENAIPFTDIKNFDDNPIYKDIPHIHLKVIKISENRTKTILFHNGQVAEYQLTLIIKTQIKTYIQNTTWYPVNIVISKSFSNNPMSISANDVKEDNVRQYIYKQAAQELIEYILYSVP